jgi:hypothetical protein
MGLWEIVNEVERERRSEQRKYPPDHSRIDRLLERQTRILFTLLPHERPKLKSVAPPPEPGPKCDLSKLTDQEMHELARLLCKVAGKDFAAEAEKLAAAERTNHRPASGSAPARAACDPNEAGRAANPNANHLRTRYAGKPPPSPDRGFTIPRVKKTDPMTLRMRRRMKMMFDRRKGAQFQRLAKNTAMTAVPAPLASRPAMVASQSFRDDASALDTTLSTTPKRKPQPAQRSNRAGLTVTPRGPNATS